MKNPLKFTLLLVLFFASIAIGYFAGTFYSSVQHSDADVENVFLALTKISNEKISKNNNHCNEESITVGDFISSYLHWSFIRDTFSYSTITCKGEDIQQCLWRYGKHGGDGYGWSTNLKFTYDQKTKFINTNSLLCEKW